MAAGYRIGVDIGGTFTDVCLVDQGGRLVNTAKVRTTPQDPSLAVVEGVKAVLPGEPVVGVVHATTLITNAIVERRGGVVGLLVTKGFADTLEIARQHRYDMYDLRLERPAPLVERGLRREVDERVLFDGTVEKALDPAEVERLAGELAAAGAEAIAVCFLHPYAHPAHERAAADAVARAAPGRQVSLSSRISGQIREYERMVTTVANAYVQPVAARYLDRLSRGLAEAAPGAGLTIMTSNGGVTGVAAALEAPVRLIESGPAAGALAAAADCAALALNGLLSFDMGGTTAKACVVVRGADGEVRPDVTPEIEVARVYRFTKGSGLPLQVPSVELIEIGAGGGSIARVDRLGRLQVGPESAGADPGPACYPSVDGRARHDAEPTVTDADVVLGYVGAEAFLGGRMRLDVEAARRALLARLGPAATGSDGRRGQREVDGQGVDARQALELASRVRTAIDEQMALAFRRHCAERGYDPAERPVYAFGGAGPVHACSVAELLGARRVIVPPAAGVGSAVGLLAASPRVDLARTHFLEVGPSADWAPVERAYDEMKDEARALLRTAGVTDDEVRFDYAADLRFVGQAHQLTVLYPDTGDLRDVFEREYARVYGRIPPGVGVQALQWRLIGRGATPEAPAFQAGGAHLAEDRRTRQAWFAGEPRETRVYARAGLPSQVDGPALIEEDASTTVVPPGWRCHVLQSGHLDISR
jgi:N-methylhydantoinase A